ncbi:uncharacterized protein LOC114938831 isoform X1 [Nylanderia fulva]|uniref:uncharacterized protein LOC114938831 isoform X1 n=3 Tax=Nylanderia fulva TaxID=613905 RepID=UPI0010FB6BCC|nr:uncharacterized protein LOC114938831 isoform X1 [Nylanderia fulva]
MQMQKYSIVEFNDENTVEIIPSSWISFDKETTLWPNTISPAILKKYLKNNTQPNDDWTSVHIRVLGHADNLTEAMKKAERAQDTSQLSSSDDSTSDTTNTRQKKSQHKHHNLSDEDDEDDALASKNQYKINSEKGPKSNKNKSIQRDEAEKSKKISYQNLNSSSNEEDDLASGNQCTVNSDKRPNVPSFPDNELNLQRDSQADPVLSNKSNTTIQRSEVEKSKNIQQIKEGILTKIFKLMEEVRFETVALKKGQQEIKVKLDTLLTHNDNSVINTFSHLLPICSMESFDEIDQGLKNSEENFISLIKYLNLGSGETVKALVPSVMKLLMKKTVSMHFSGSGKQKKRDFSATKVAAAVFEVVSKKIPNVSRNEILQKISKFLAESGDREGGRKERFSKSTN